jgi:hypothetical protein
MPSAFGSVRQACAAVAKRACGQRHGTPKRTLVISVAKSIIVPIANSLESAESWLLDCSNLSIG